MTDSFCQNSFFFFPPLFFFFMQSSETSTSTPLPTPRDCVKLPEGKESGETLLSVYKTAYDAENVSDLTDEETEEALDDEGIEITEIEEDGTVDLGEEEF